MDAVQDIKARLSIEELVRQYTQLTKKGRNFVGLCPFHNDTKPSFLVSPDKGICYCFPCQKGGDIFSFYQLIEGVDFPQALKDLAERTGVQLPDRPEAIKKDEKDRLRDCLEAANVFFQKNLTAKEPTLEYLAKRGVDEAERKHFQLGFAPDSFSETYDHLLKAGFGRKDIVTSGLAIQKDLADERMYDRFRNRLTFPIHDLQGRLIGFGGRTMGNDDAKYLNSSESPLYHKSNVLFGIHLAKEAMREKKQVIVVEGYFDVLACHRVGAIHTVGSCGTALTDEHAKLLKRYVDTVVLCLDQDRAGREAAERAFQTCCKEGLAVNGIVLGTKDPADAAVENAEGLKAILETGGKPYLDIVLEDIASQDLNAPAVRRAALDRLLTLLQALPTSTDRTFWMRKAAEAMKISETALQDDLRATESSKGSPVRRSASQSSVPHAMMFSSADIALGLFLMYPTQLALAAKLTEPDEPFAKQLFDGVKSVTRPQEDLLAAMALPEETRQRAGILVLFCEENGMGGWSDSTAIREINKMIDIANRDVKRRKIQEISKKILIARNEGKKEEEQILNAEFSQLMGAVS